VCVRLSCQSFSNINVTGRIITGNIFYNF
jgi:hypothetical protein